MSKITIDRAVVEQALEACSGTLARCTPRALQALRAALEQHQRNHSCDNELQRETRHLSTTSSSVPTGWKLVPVELTQSMIDQLRFGWSDISTAHVIDRWKRTISAAPQPTVVEQEPVAWMCTETGVLYDTDTSQVDKHHGFKPTVPLYTHPKPRQPLTPEQLQVLMPKPREKGWIYTEAQVRSFARKVERAHGIGGEK